MNIKAFSLIELMVVIAIVALLAAVAAPSYKTYVGKAKTAAINSLIGQSMHTLRQNYDLSTSLNETVTLNSVPGLDSIITSFNPSSTLSDNYVEVRLAEVTGIDPLLDEGVYIHYSPTLINGEVKFTCTLIFPLPDLTLEIVNSYFPSCIS